jgi:glutamine phosphoribosylpyrophosphate amidotransferase
VGIGHVRYPTAGSSLTSPFGIVLANTGNLVN